MKKIGHARRKHERKEEPGVIFMGRLGRYWYADMDDVIAAALRIAEEIINDGGNK